MAISPSPFDRIQKSRRTSSRLWLVWVLVAIGLIAVVFGFRAQATELFWRLTAPALRLRETLGASQAGVLRAELASTSAALADRNALYRENLELKARLGRTDVPQRVLAAVLQRPPWTPYDTLLIDAGANYGLTPGDLVSAGGRALVGSVAEVHADTARVELFSAPGRTYQALLRGTVPLAVEGQGGDSMVAQAPTGTQVAVGDEVLIPGVAGGLAATVTAVDRQAAESFIVIYMRLPGSPTALRFVEVWTQ